jgi:heme-degrading monooxygenase HmoA
MTRCLPAFAVVILLSSFAVLGWGADSAAAEPAREGKVLRHVVMYKFKEGVTPAQVQEVIDTFAALPRKIDTIIGFEHGENVSKEGKSEGFTHVFVVTFRDEQGLADYLVHPAHDAYVKVVRDRREKVVVFDYWTDAK